MTRPTLLFGMCKISTCGRESSYTSASRSMTPRSLRSCDLPDPSRRHHHPSSPITTDRDPLASASASALGARAGTRRARASSTRRPRPSSDRPVRARHHPRDFLLDPKSLAASAVFVISTAHARVFLSLRTAVSVSSASTVARPHASTRRRARANDESYFLPRPPARERAFARRRARVCREERPM